MVVLEYGKFILVSSPRKNDELQVWLPYASIARLDGTRWQYRQLKDLDGIFDTEEEALAFGFAVARAWVDREH